MKNEESNVVNSAVLAYRAIICLLYSGFFLCTAVAAAAPSYVPGEVLVKYRATASAVSIQASMPLASDYKDIAPGVMKIKLKKGQTVEQSIEALQEYPDIEHVQPNFIKRMQRTPNDSFYSSQWGLSNTGQAVQSVQGAGTDSGTPGADINAEPAWDVTTGSPNVIVAVIDTGITSTHNDIAANLWTNPEETLNGVDDDGNGYIDDINGWDFVSNDDDPLDMHGHGTMVAGVLAARGSNGIGISGVVWQASIMPLRAMDENGFATTTTVVSAIDYAIAKGAKIINLSIGSPQFDQFEADAIQRARNMGVLVVAGACNDGVDIDVPQFSCYPAGYVHENIISVAASDQDDIMASFSNWGTTSVDVAAPGVNIISTVAAMSSIRTDTFSSPAGWVFGGTPNTWAVSNEVLEDSPGGDYQINTNNWARSPVINLLGRQGCRAVIDFLSIDLEQSFDTIIIEGSTDLLNWVPFTGFLSAVDFASSTMNVDISDFDGAGSFYFRFRLQTNDSVVLNGVVIDTFSVECYDSSGHSGYAFASGTSFAAPFVSGVAALLLSEKPGLSPTQLRQIITNSVSLGVSLDLINKVTSGGRVDAAAALATAGSVPVGGSSNSGGGILNWLSLFILLCLTASRHRFARADFNHQSDS